MSIHGLPTFASFFFFNDTATTEIYTLSLHDALPISRPAARRASRVNFSSGVVETHATTSPTTSGRDRKSTRLNSSHSQISYAVFCLKKKRNRPLHAPARQGRKTMDLECAVLARATRR